MAKLAVIGGTGLNRLSVGELRGERVVETPYGSTSAPLREVSLGTESVLFLPRHGSPHTIPPHKINYRANLWALKEAGVERVVAINAVGGIARDMLSGVVMLPNQIVDYTYGREHTFYDGSGPTLEHVDFSYPFCTSLREWLMDYADVAGVEVVDGGVYAATQGPRLESAAEINRLERDGCHVVGMTGMPEAGLARELGLDYAMLCLVVNPAAGRGSEPITLEAMQLVIDEGMAQVESILQCALSSDTVSA